jgi:hypothetical protein
MRKTILFMTIIFISISVQAKKIAELPDIMKPDQMEVGKGRLFVSEGANIYIYSLKDFSLIKKFGKQGEGPQEFKINPFGPPMVIAVIDDKFWVSSDTKLSTWTLDGEFIKEIKVPPFQVFFPAKDRYLASGTSQAQNGKSYLNIGLYDQSLKMIKELYQSDMEVGPNFSWNFPMNPFSFQFYKDVIYVVAGKEGFVLYVFNLKGEKITTIKKEYPLIEVPASYKDEILSWFQKSPNFKQYFDFFKQRITFRSHFPAIQWMTVTDDRIYALTFKQKNGLTECIILDLIGNELKRSYLPLTGIRGNTFDFPAFTIADKIFYTLIENEDNEVWELHQVDL